MKNTSQTVEAFANRAYPYGFVTAIDTESTPPGLDDDIIRVISAKKDEPAFMLEWRLNAYRHWRTMERSAGEPRWANVTHPPIDFDGIVYYSAPRRKSAASLDEVDPEILR